MCSSRTILLVGEGNFSFSASVSQLYSETNITATCLQHQDEALRHEGSATNIQSIQDSGGEVLFGVDCTKLAQCASLKGRVFDRVVFNFPHCGRKSGVKKNRELLKNFFLSCVQLLSEDGEIHVSLCNGQGGTPADHPKREWHNSWQVTAMAAEAHLILSHVRPFESDKYQSYKCTGYSPAQTLQVEEAVEGHRVEYNIPAELSDYMFRGFLCSGSIHPVRLVQDFLLKGLADKWSVSMTKETVPFLLTAKQLQASCPDFKSTHCYLIHLLQKYQNCDARTSKNIEKHQGHTDTLSAMGATSDKVRIKEAESLMSACSLVDAEGEGGHYVLRPTLLPHIEELLPKRLINNAGRHGENEGNSKSVEGHKKEGPFGGSNGVTSLLFGISGLVFKSVPVNLWAPPAFHELLLRGIFPSDCNPVKLFGQRLEELLAPYGVSLSTDQGGLRLKAQPMGLVGRVFASNEGDNISDVCVTVSLNLDLLAVLLFSLPDWRLLWSHDPRFIQHFELCPSPGKPFQPFSLYPEHFSFDISFWTGPMWDERKFHAVIREASHGTVEQVKLIDTFSHPDLSQTSYCYRLIYHSHTHALSHTQALHFHKDMETFLTSRLQVTIR